MKKISLSLLSVCLVLISAVYPNHALAWVASGTPLSYSSFATGINYATQIDLDGSGNVYVSGYQGFGGDGVAKYNSSGTFLTSFGAFGSTGVAVDPDGNILVVDYQGSNMEKYTSTGTPINITGTDLDTQTYNSVYAVATDSSGNIYVANAGTNEIFKFNSALTKIATITGNSGAFSFPEAVAVDSSNNLYVLDSGNNRVQKFNSSGVWQLTVTGNGTAFSYPEALTVDTNGNIYVGDSGNNRIQIFDTTGVFQQEITQANINASMPTLTYISGMGFSDPSTLYVGDSSRVFKINFDHTDPVVTIDSFPGNETSDTTPTITGNASDSVTAITAVEYRIDSGSYSACTADDAAFDETAEDFSCDVSPAILPGSHLIEIRATDSKNNTNVTLGSYTFTISAASASTSPTPTPTVDPDDSNEVNTHCSQLPPSSAPTIVQIARNGSTAVISYTPLSSTPSGYQLMYGHSPTDERFAVAFPAIYASGILRYTVSYLVPTQTYYFWMRAMNECAPGPWSNTVATSGEVETDVLLSTESPSPTPTSSPSLQVASEPSESTLDQIFELSTLPSLVQVELEIVDQLDLPIEGVEVVLTDTETQEIVSQGITNAEGTVAIQGPVGEYNLNTTTHGVEQTQGMILAESTEKLTVTVKLPIKDLIIRQIQSPVDASYLTKASVVVVAGNASIASALGFIGLSQSMIMSLLQIYQNTSRSFWRLPFDYFAGLFKYLGIQFLTLLYPIFPALRKIKKTAGVVIDAITNQGVGKVYILAYSQSGNLKTDFSDEKGKYSFQDLPEDEYEIRAEKVGYIFPSALLTSPKTPQYQHVYLPGEKIPVKKDEAPFADLVLPLDPSAGVTRIQKLKYHLRKIRIPSYVAGFGIAIMAVVTNPNIFNQVVLATLTLYSLYQYRSQKLLG